MAKAKHTSLSVYLFVRDGNHAPISNQSTLLAWHKRDDHIMGVRVTLASSGYANLQIWIHQQEFVYLADIIFHRLDHLSSPHPVSASSAIEITNPSSDQSKTGATDSNEERLNETATGNQSKKRNASGRPTLKESNPDEYYFRLCMAQKAVELHRQNSGMGWKEAAKEIGWPYKTDADIKRLRDARKNLEKATPEDLDQVALLRQRTGGNCADRQK